MIVKELSHRQVILVCTEKDCREKGCRKTFKRLKAEISAAGLKREIHVQRCRCLGHCKDGPNLLVYPQGLLCTGMKPKHVPELLERLRDT